MRHARVGVSAIAVLGIAALAILVSSGGHPAPSKEQLLKNYSKLPIAFIENRGQTDSRVRYYAQGSRYTFFLTTDEIVLSLVTQPGTVTRAAYTQTAGVAIGLRFIAGNTRVAIEADERLPGEVSYFRGNDPRQWRSALPRYARIVYRDLWPGVDLRLRDQSGALKYELLVRPGARIADIRLAYTGIEGLALSREGALLIRTASGVLRDSPPESYQEIAGERVPVRSRYVLSGGEYGFAVGEGYRPEHPLVIDPGLDYSTFLGGSAHEYGAAIAVDGAGNAYITGITQSPDFPTRPGSFDRTGAAQNNLDVFVSKLNSSGSALIYSTFLGGGNFEWGRGIAIDAAGNAYITGQTKSSNFPTTGGAFDRTFNVDTCPRCGTDQYDAFVTKLNASGSALVYSTFLGGFDLDDGMAIAVDAAGSAYVAGQTGSSNFPTTAGAFNRT